MRFLIVQEPIDTWAVVDTIVDVPADFATQCLIGLTRDSAEWFAARCNQTMSRSVLGNLDTPRRAMKIPETVGRQAK